VRAADPISGSRTQRGALALQVTDGKATGVVF